MRSFLRSLTPEQQVSLLFVLVFGLLLLATAGAILLMTLAVMSWRGWIYTAS